MDSPLEIYQDNMASLILLGSEILETRSRSLIVLGRRSLVNLMMYATSSLHIQVTLIVPLLLQLRLTLFQIPLIASFEMYLPLFQLVLSLSLIPVQRFKQSPSHQRRCQRILCLQVEELMEKIFHQDGHKKRGEKDSEGKINYIQLRM